MSGVEVFFDPNVGFVEKSSEKAAEQEEGGKENKSELSGENDEPEVKEAEEDKEAHKQESEESGDNELDPFKAFVKDIADMGVISEEDITDDLNPDSLMDVIARSYEKRVESEIERFKASLSEDGIRFIDYIRSGGSPQEFFATYAPSVSALNVPDDAPADAKIAFIRSFITTYKGMSENEASDLITYIDREGKLDEYVRMYKKEAAEISRREQERLLNEAMERQRIEKESLERFISEMESAMNDASVFPKDIRGKLISYISTPTVNVNGQMVSRFQADLANVLSDPKKAPMLAKVLMEGVDKFVKKTGGTTRQARKSRLSNAFSSGKFNISDWKR